MAESFDDVVREYIDFVNQQVGMYMDALAGFAGHGGHRDRVDSQLMEYPRNGYETKFIIETIKPGCLMMKGSWLFN